MIRCNVCSGEAVENQALGKKFWYCRTCKAETSPVFISDDSDWLTVLDEEYKYDFFFAPTIMDGKI